ncbi:MAG: enoyl-CoA hydratase-related protein [Alphaproteobacteria bacterium]|nr:enoyl-CoA hydratase-related protein [Alphaproteobacteria bacterium]
MTVGEAVRYEVKDHIATITLNRPAKKNAINRAMRREVQDAYTDVKFNPDIWLAIVTAEGDVFCAGKDLLEKGPEEDGKVMSNDELYLFQRGIYKPMICALNGPCFAQGGGFALMSDIIVMSERASIGWPQVRRGISSVSGPTLCAHAIPWPQAMSYLMRGVPIPAEECLRWGLANEIVPHEQLMTTALRWAGEILQAAPLAVRAIKESARRGFELPAEDRIYMARDVANRILHSEDSKEGIDAFREKRQPVWKGR